MPVTKNCKQISIVQSNNAQLSPPRSVYLVHEKDESFDGLPAAKFVLPKSVLENRTNEPENECFCLDENNEGRCPNTGAMFIGACYEGECTSPLLYLLLIVASNF